jgi:hypothetical protein
VLLATCAFQPGPYVIKLFTAINDEFCNRLTRVFVPGKPFQPSLIFAGKALHYRVSPWPYTQTLDLGGKACRGQNTQAYYENA